MLLLSLLACSPFEAAPQVEDSGDSGDTAATLDSGVDPLGCFQDPPAVSVGTGESSWEPLADGDELTMVHGPQGGWHMLASARVTDMDPIVDLHFTVTLLDGAAIVGDNRYTVALIEAGPCAGYYPGMFAYLDVTALANGELDTPPELLAYQELRLWMEASDGSGRRAEDERIVVAVPDPQDID